MVISECGLRGEAQGKLSHSDTTVNECSILLVVSHQA